MQDLNLNSIFVNPKIPYNNKFLGHTYKTLESKRSSGPVFTKLLKLQGLIQDSISRANVALSLSIAGHKSYLEAALGTMRRFVNADPRVGGIVGTATASYPRPLDTVPPYE